MTTDCGEAGRLYGHRGGCGFDVTGESDLRLEHDGLSEDHQTYQLRRNRLERLLRFWRAAEMNRCDPDGYQWTSWNSHPPPARTAMGRAVWRRFVLESEVLPPRDYIAGTNAIIALHNSASNEQWSHEQLIKDGVLLIRGNRVAWRYGNVPGDQPQHQGYSWTFKLRDSIFQSDELGSLKHMVLQEFRSGTSSSAETYAGEAIGHNRSGDLALLVAEANSGRDLFDLWCRAAVLGISREFSVQLGEPFRTALAQRLGEELLSARDQLTLAIDLELNAFSEPNRSQELMRTLPQTRLGALLDTQQHWFQPDPIGSHYFDDIAVSLVDCAPRGELDSIIRELPDGETLRVILRRMRESRPGALAQSLTSHLAVTESLAAITALRNRIHDGSGSIEMEEWQEAQLLARRIFVADLSTTTDPLDVHVLGIADERRQFGVRRRNDVPTLPVSERLIGWEIRLRDEAQVERLSATMLDLVHRNDWTPDDATFRYWLRLIGVVQRRNQLWARRLAVEFVDAYANRFQLGTRPADPVELDAEPALLCTLANILPADSDAWKKWLQPFSVSELLESGRIPIRERISSRESTPAIDVQRIIGTHSRNLLVQALRSPTVVATQLIHTFIAMYEAEARNPTLLRPFRFPQTHTGAGFNGNLEPVLVLCGKTLLLLDANDAQKQLERFTSLSPSAVELAQLAWGVVDSESCTRIVGPCLDRALGQIEEETNVALGETLDLARALYHARRFEAGKRWARRAIDICNAFKITSMHVEIASHLLTACLAGLGDWKGILEVTRDHNPSFQNRDDFDNLSAVACLNEGAFASGETLLRAVLSRDPNNKLALSNLSALFAFTKDWEGCRKAGYEAVDKLGEETPHVVWQNIAIAEQALGNGLAAARALQNIPRSEATQPSIITLRAELSAMILSRLDPQLEADLRKLEEAHPESAQPARSTLALHLRPNANFEYQVLTEDEKIQWLKILIEANGGDLSKIDIDSYRGTDKPDLVADRVRYTRKHFPSVRMIVHRDADYLLNDELAAEGLRYTKHGGHLFATSGLMVEGYFCRLEHLIELNPEYANLLPQLHSEVLAACEEKLRNAAIKGRIDVLMKSKGKDQKECVAIATEWAAGLDMRAERWAYGKLFLRRLRERFKDDTKKSLVVAKGTRFLIDDGLQQLLIRS